jgi:hypothetical protein
VIHRPPHVIRQDEVREEPRRVTGCRDVQPRLDEVLPATEPADLRLRIVGALAHVLVPLQPVARHAVGVNDRHQVHVDHARQLVVAHLDGVLDAVVERVGTARAERRLERIEDEVLCLGAHGVDGDLPARVVRSADGR